MNGIYQNLNLKNNDVERVMLVPLSSDKRVIEAVVFSGYIEGVSCDIVVHWTKACEFWRATRKSVKGVRFAGQAVTSLAEWRGISTQAGVIKTWFVEVGQRTRVLTVEIGVEYQQHPLTEQLEQVQR